MTGKQVNKLIDYCHKRGLSAHDYRELLDIIEVQAIKGENQVMVRKITQAHVSSLVEHLHKRLKSSIYGSRNSLGEAYERTLQGTKDVMWLWLRKNTDPAEPKDLNLTEEI